MSKVIAVGNLKGGVGKSTVAVNLACALARPERSVLLVDADAQGTASAWLTGHQPAAALLSVHVVPIPLMEGDDPEAWIGRVTALRHRYGLVVIDLPPQVGLGIAAALRLADLFLVPVTPLGPDLKGTARALSLVQRARTADGEPPACILVPSRIDRRTALGRRATAVFDRSGWWVGPAIHQRAAHVEAFGAGQWIGAYHPDGEAHTEIRALADAVERLLAQPAEQPVSAVCPADPIPADSGQRHSGTAAVPPQQPAATCLTAAGAAAGATTPQHERVSPASIPSEPVSPAASAGGADVGLSAPAAGHRRPAEPWLAIGAWVRALVQSLRRSWLRPSSRLARTAGGRGL